MGPELWSPPSSRNVYFCTISSSTRTDEKGRGNEGGLTPQVQPVPQVHSASPVHPHPPDMSAFLDWGWGWGWEVLIVVWCW